MRLADFPLNRHGIPVMPERQHKHARRYCPAVRFAVSYPTEAAADLATGGRAYYCAACDRWHPMAVKKNRWLA